MRHWTCGSRSSTTTGPPLLATFVEGVLGSLDARGVVSVSEERSASKARTMARDGEVAAAFIIPLGFSDAAQSGSSAELSVITDPESTIGAQIAASVTNEFATELNSVQPSVATVLAGGGRSRRSRSSGRDGSVRGDGGPVAGDDARQDR